MDIIKLIQMSEQDAKINGIDLKSPLTKDFVQFWTDHEVKEALKRGDYGYAFGLSKFNEWVQKY